MDPLSIAASTVALFGFCLQLQKGIKSVRQLAQVPDEITALLDELKGFCSVLGAVRVVAQRRGDIDGLGASSQGFNVLLDDAWDILTVIAGHCGVTVGQEGDATFKKANDSSEAPKQDLNLRTRCRWVKSRKKIDQYRKRLKTVRGDIASHLAILNL